jgi:hypothetical protein
VEYDLGALTCSPSAVARIPLFLFALLIVRGAPAARYTVGRRGAVAAGFLQATSLPVIVTAASIGVAIRVIPPVTASALVAAACGRQARPAVGAWNWTARHGPPSFCSPVDWRSRRRAPVITANCMAAASNRAPQKGREQMSRAEFRRWRLAASTARPPGTPRRSRARAACGNQRRPRPGPRAGPGRGLLEASTAR